MFANPDALPNPSIPMSSVRRPHPDRLYLCFDVDRFSAQVVAAYNPLFRKAPFVVVRQDTDSHRCTVWACSVPARELGIQPGTPFQMLKKGHPEVQVVHRDPELEQTACEDLREILQACTPDVEVRADGSGVLNLSGTPSLRRADPEAIAAGVAETARYRIGLEEIAFGISRNKLLAGLLARMARPDSIRMCDPGQEETVLGSLDARLLPGLSSGCRERIRKYGLHRIEQIQRLGRDALICRLGKEGERVYSLTRGVESRPEPSVDTRPVQTETVLDRDINDTDTLVQNVRLTADRLCFELKKHGLQARRVMFLLRYADNRTVQRSAVFPVPTDDVATVSHGAVRVFHELYQRRVAIKSLTLTVRQPQTATGQLGLFETGSEARQRRLDEAVTNVRKRMGFGSVRNGAYFGTRNKELKIVK
jgi:DNA polymerase-4